MNLSTLFNDVHGNASTKRLCGVACVAVGLLMAICSGFHWYQVDMAAYATVLGSGSALLASTALERKPGEPVA